MSLQRFGWTPAHQTQWDALALSPLQPARVIADFGTSLKLALPEIVTAELSGKLAHYSGSDATPKVGDWVAVHVSALHNYTVEQVVIRKNEIARKVAGKQARKQVFAANIDVAFVLLALDNDFSIERVQRFLYQLSIHNIDPIIVLNKADTTDDLKMYTQQLHQFDVPVIVTTALQRQGIEQIQDHILPGDTAILLGSSGVGKSTLTNALLGRDVQRTAETRSSDNSGRHTTVHRELFILANGGILIDTPGIRELQLWGSEVDLKHTFNEVLTLTRQCKYTSCQHKDEDGCAVQAALANGQLDKKQYDQFLKMKQELLNLSDKKIAREKMDNARPKRYGETRRASRKFNISDND